MNYPNKIKVKFKEDMKNIPIEVKDEEGKVDYGTRWPTTIGGKKNSNDDGLIRDSRGVIMS